MYQRLGHLAPFERLWRWHSACALPSAVGPPTTHGHTWSACAAAARHRKSTPLCSQRPPARENIAARSDGLKLRLWSRHLLFLPRFVASVVRATKAAMTMNVKWLIAA